jgi:hypothetical protein
LPEEQSIFTQKLAVEEGSERLPTSEVGESESQLKLKNKDQNHQLFTKTNDVGSCYIEVQVNTILTQILILNLLEKKNLFPQG